MNKFNFARVYVLALALGIAVLALLACGTTTTEKLWDAARQPTITAPAVESTQAPTSEAKPTSTPLPAEPTSTPTPAEPASTPTPEPEAIHIIAQGFGQDERELGFAFLVENPNAGFAIESSQYQIAAYNDAGAVVETDSGYIELILPSQTFGVGGTMWLDEGVTVSKIEVQLKEGNTVATDPIPTFTADSITYYASEYSPSATGIISSPYNRDLTNLRVSAVAYNEAGEIVGGGFTYLNFILANSSTGVDVSVTSAEDVATVELYPSLSTLSFLKADDELPGGTNDLVLTKQGFGQYDRDAGFGMLIRNPNDGFAVENSQYHLTAFAEDGSVLTTEGGYVEVLLPNQTLGVGGHLWLDEGMAIVRVDIQVIAGSFEESDQLPSFTAENITYHAEGYSPKVTGEIISPYTKDITNVRVSSIAYNKAGEIIGGGFTYLDFVPANGKAAVEVSTTSAEAPATTELYATVSGLSDYD